MQTRRAIPEGYMRIGEMASKAGVSINTLRHYDKEGLLVPSGLSEGGYRLYNDKDLAKLMQIILMKRLGFTLSEISEKIAAMDTAAQVLEVLTEHADLTRKKIECLTESLKAMELLKEEIAMVDAVDFKKFASILANLQMKNERYWIAKYLDDDVHDIIMMHNGTWDEESASKLVADVNIFIEEALKLHDGGVSPESEQGWAYAEKFWAWMMKMTGGDMGMVMNIAEQTSRSESDEKHDESLKKSLNFMGLAMSNYCNNGFIEEAAKLHDENVPPESGRGVDFAERYWKWLTMLFGDDMAKIQELSAQLGKNADKDEITKKALIFIEAALGNYFNKMEAGNNG